MSTKLNRRVRLGTSILASLHLRPDRNRGRTFTKERSVFPSTGDESPSDPVRDAIMHEVRRGDRDALGILIRAVEGELRRRASRKLRHESHGISVGTTALFDEAIMRIVASGVADLNDAKHFCNRVSVAMQHILVDRARHRRLEHMLPRTQFEKVLDLAAARIEEKTECGLEEFGGVLEQFSKDHPDLAELVRLKVFVEMTNVAIAKSLSCSPRTIERQWRAAKALLAARLK